MSKVLLDTSIWITFFRGREKKLTHEVSRLLTRNLVVTSGPVVMELLQGVASEREMVTVRSLLEPVERIALAEEDWIDAAELSFWLRRKGVTTPTVDVLLAYLAIKNDCLLYSQDKHFPLMAKHSELKLYQL